MNHPIQDCCSDDRVSENFIPLAKASVGSQDQSSPLVTVGDELEEKMSALTIDRDVANLIYDKEHRLTVELEPLLDTILRVSSAQGGNQRHGLSEVCPVVNVKYFSHSRRPQKNDILSIGDKSAGGQLLDPLFIDRRLKVEVKALQSLDERKLGQGGSHDDVLFLLGRNFLREQLVQKITV